MFVVNFLYTRWSLGINNWTPHGPVAWLSSWCVCHPARRLIFVRYIIYIQYSDFLVCVLLFFGLFIVILFPVTALNALTIFPHIDHYPYNSY